MSPRASQLRQISITAQRALLDELADDAKRYLNAANAYSQVQRKLADEVLELYEPSAPMYNAGLQYQTGAIAIEKHMKDVAKRWKEEFTEPLHEYIEQYAELRKRIDARDTRRVDQVRCLPANARRGQRLTANARCCAQDRFFREYLHSLEEPSHDPRRVVAKKETYEEARDAYVALNRELLQDMKVLYDDRVKFLSSLFARMVISQAELLQETQAWCAMARRRISSYRLGKTDDAVPALQQSQERDAAPGQTRARGARHQGLGDYRRRGDGGGWRHRLFGI